MNKKTLLIDVESAQQLLNYLVNRPHKEVAELVPMLLNLKLSPEVGAEIPPTDPIPAAQ